MGPYTSLGVLLRTHVFDFYGVSKSGQLKKGSQIQTLLSALIWFCLFKEEHTIITEE